MTRFYDFLKHLTTDQILFIGSTSDANYTSLYDAYEAYKRDPERIRAILWLSNATPMSRHMRINVGGINEERRLWFGPANPDVSSPSFTTGIKNAQDMIDLQRAEFPDGKALFNINAPHISIVGLNTYETSKVFEIRSYDHQIHDTHISEAFPDPLLVHGTEFKGGLDIQNYHVDNVACWVDRWDPLRWHRGGSHGAYLSKKSSNEWLSGRKITMKHVRINDVTGAAIQVSGNAEVELEDVMGWNTRSLFHFFTLEEGDDGNIGVRLDPERQPKIAVNNATWIRTDVPNAKDLPGDAPGDDGHLLWSVGAQVHLKNVTGYLNHTTAKGPSINGSTITYDNVRIYAHNECGVLWNGKVPSGLQTPDRIVQASPPSGVTIFPVMDIPTEVYDKFFSEVEIDTPDPDPDPIPGDCPCNEELQAVYAKLHLVSTDLMALKSVAESQEQKIEEVLRTVKSKLIAKFEQDA